MALWGGRFSGGPDPLFQQLNDSLSFDVALAREDIEGSIAWARAIHRARVLNDDELARLVTALESLRTQVLEQPMLPLTEGGARHEDIHSWVEARLIEAVGPLGKKLHTGRSRNDQVATDLRLWTRARLDERIEQVRNMRARLITFATEQSGVILPGYTHLQRAQPVLLPHWALAYEAMLERDTQRLLDARRRANVCPLGSGALAGTAYPIDRVALARDLGFDLPTTNSLDAVSDRDFALESLAALSILGVHLSRLGEDLVLYGSGEFAFFEYDDAFSSGSSLMPQKKNPDAAELLRAKVGRVVGSFVTLTTVLKGLPLAYNKDLQEDKEPLFDAMRTADACLRAAARVFEGVRVDRARCEQAALGGYSNATDLADYLVGRGVPFRDAHEQAGRCVRAAIELGIPIEGMTLAQIREHAPSSEQGVFGAISLAAGFGKREVLGGTGPRAVAAAMTAARERLEAETRV